MKRYTNMKDSGVEWIGEIPEHWDLNHLKRIVDEPLKYGANEAADEEIKTNPRYLRITDFDKSGKLRKGTFKSLPMEVAKDYLLTEGDILFARSGATVGKTFQFKDYKGKACFAGYLIKATTSKKVISDYLYLYTKTGHYECWKESIFNQATIQNIGADKYNMLLVPVPPKPEQTAIVAFLDEKTSKIDELIAKKERKIELLKEQRKALINQAVTKGLDPTVPMKDSGVEWIGEIPEGWKKTRLDYISDVIDPQPDHRAPAIDENGLPYVAIRDIDQYGNVNTETARRVVESAVDKQEKSFHIESGDIIFCKVGTLGIPRFIKLPDTRIALSATLVLIKPKDYVINRFIRYALDSNYIGEQIERESTGSTRRALGIQVIRRFYLFLPPLNELAIIEEYLDKELSSLDLLISKESKKIELLKEYRQALISEVVTGKIDVSDYATSSSAKSEVMV